MDRAAHRVRRAGKEVHLGPTEYKLLDHLIQHPGRVFSREQLLDAVWGSDVYVEARTVDVHVGRLRKALNVEGVKDPIRHRPLRRLLPRRRHRGELGRRAPAPRRIPVFAIPRLPGATASAMGPSLKRDAHGAPGHR